MKKRVFGLLSLAFIGLAQISAFAQTATSPSDREIRNELTKNTVTTGRAVTDFWKNTSHRDLVHQLMMDLLTHHHFIGKIDLLITSNRSSNLSQDKTGANFNFDLSIRATDPKSKVSKTYEFRNCAISIDPTGGTLTECLNQVSEDGINFGELVSREDDITKNFLLFDFLDGEISPLVQKLMNLLASKNHADVILYDFTSTHSMQGDY